MRDGYIVALYWWVLMLSIGFIFTLIYCFALKGSAGVGKKDGAGKDKKRKNFGELGHDSYEVSRGNSDGYPVPEMLDSASGVEYVPKLLRHLTVQDSRDLKYIVFRKGGGLTEEVYILNAMREAVGRDLAIYSRACPNRNQELDE